MTLGKTIRSARERKGISIAALASTTRILSATLEAIEADDYSNLPSAVYVRGFVRSVAVALEMDVKRTLVAFDRQVAMPGPGEGEDVPLAPAYGDEEAVVAPAQNMHFGTLAAIALFAVIAGFLFLGVGEENAPQAEASTTDVVDSKTVK